MRPAYPVEDVRAAEARAMKAQPPGALMARASHALAGEATGDSAAVRTGNLSGYCQARTQRVLTDALTGSGSAAAAFASKALLN